MTAPRARKAAATESFDAFWAEQSKGGRTTIIRGVTIPVPTDLPLAVEMRAEELQDSTAEADIREVLGLLFGVDVLDEWRDAGMGLRELQTVLAWAIGQASGKDLTFAEAYAAVLEADGEGKAPSGQNRAARRSQSKPTGGRSKPTSSASTGTARRTSRA